MVFAQIVAGIVLLVAGGDTVVRGAGRLALAAGVRPLVVGLTVVAFCTSAPELAASITAANAGSPGLAVGNVLGSNIANIGLILGLSGLVRPIRVQSTLLRRELPVLLAASLAVMLLARDGSLSRGDGALLLAALFTYLGVMIRAELRAVELATDAEVQEAVGKGGVLPNLGWVGLGVGFLVAGADQLVDGAVGLARRSGLSEAVVGLTIVAVGTSLPELAASIAAARKGQGDIVLGNVVGSNIFNVLCILGATAVIQPIEGAMAAFTRDLAVVVAFSVLLWPLLGRGRTLFRHEAGILLVGWGGYTWWIV